MRLEIKILAILFLLVGIYVGVTLLPERQTDEKERLPEGLILTPMEEDDMVPDTSIFYPWVEMGENLDRSKYQCPQGWQNPGETLKEAFKRNLKERNLKPFGKRKKPDNFLQRHFCQWCKNRSNSDSEAEQLEDAALFSSRRWDGKITKNTVIAGGRVEYAKWEPCGNYCSHDYASVFQCWDISENNWDISENNTSCRYVGECKTFHHPDYVHTKSKAAGHLETRGVWYRCLDPEGRYEGGYHVDPKTGEKFKNVDVSQWEPEEIKKSG